MPQIHYSRGINKFDNAPAQLTAANFDAFASAIADDRSPEKGLTYICASLTVGKHYNEPEKYPDINYWRLKDHALPRGFLAFDFDGFANPEIFEQLCGYLGRWNCLIYTTASSTVDKPRARAIVELDRLVNDDEGVKLGQAAQRCLEAAFGADAIKFDKSVYRATQPIYTPVLASDVIRHTNAPMLVDEMLQAYPAPISQVSRMSLGIDLMGSGLKPPFQWPEHMVKEGMRNSMMLSYAGHLRRRGFTEEEILATALAMNLVHFDPPLGGDEVVDICRRYTHQNEAMHNPLELMSMQPEGLFSVDYCSDVPTTPPPKRDYVFAGQVTAGTLNVLGGQGGASKTMLAMQACVAAASGSGLGELGVSTGASILVLGEEDKAECDRRLGAICAHFAVDTSLVKQRVKCLGVAGEDIRLTHKLDSNTQATKLGEEIIKGAKAHEKNAGVPIKLIVFDHARLVLGGDPNNAEDVTQLTRVLTHIARSTHAAVLLLAHSPKSVTSKEGSEINAADIAGSSAFVDNSRAGYMMWTMRDKEAKDHHIPESERNLYVRLENVKANYAHTGGGYWFKRRFLSDWDVAVLEHSSLFSPKLFESKTKSQLRDRILEQVRKKNGGITVRRLRDMAGIAGDLKASDRDVRREIEKMLEDGLLSQRAPTKEERDSYRLAGGVREVLEAMS